MSKEFFFVFFSEFVVIYLSLFGEVIVLVESFFSVSLLLEVEFEEFVFVNVIYFFCVRCVEILMLCEFFGILKCVFKCEIGMYICIVFVLFF